MKNKHFEKFGRTAKEHHRNNQWRLNSDGIWAPHLYTEKDQSGLSWWDDAGFILNDRRVIIWWQHPRNVYNDEIHTRSFDLVGPSPKESAWDELEKNKNYARRGKSRKKIISYTLPQLREDTRAWCDALRAAEQNLMDVGIDFDVVPSVKIKRLNWAVGVDIVAPLEIRNEHELAHLVALVKKLIKRQSTIDQEFPNYKYTKVDWLVDRPKM